MPMQQPRSQLTFSQQSHVRGNLMRAASAIANQLISYVEVGSIEIAGNPVDVTSERIAVWRLVLGKTIPDLSATEITHKSGLESMDQGKLVTRLAELVQTRPELAQRLQDAIGPKAIEGSHDIQAKQEEQAVPTKEPKTIDQIPEELQPIPQEQPYGMQTTKEEQASTA